MSPSPHRVIACALWPICACACRSPWRRRSKRRLRLSTRFPPFLIVSSRCAKIAFVRHAEPTLQPPFLTVRLSFPPTLPPPFPSPVFSCGGTGTDLRAAEVGPSYFPYVGRRIRLEQAGHWKRREPSGNVGHRPDKRRECVVDVDTCFGPARCHPDFGLTAPCAYVILLALAVYSVLPDIVLLRGFTVTSCGAGRPKPKDGKSRASPITTTAPPKSPKTPPKSPEIDAGG